MWICASKIQESRENITTNSSCSILATTPSSASYRHLVTLDSIPLGLGLGHAFSCLPGLYSPVHRRKALRNPIP